MNSAVVVTAFVLLYDRVFAVTFDEAFAKASPSPEQLREAVEKGSGQEPGTPREWVGHRAPTELMDEFFGRVELAFAPEGEVVPLAA